MNQSPRPESEASPTPATSAAPPGQPVSRAELARRAVVFQLKLVADGLRDAILIPVSLIAAGIGIFRGGDDADREFNSVLTLGRQTERWIDLFGRHGSSGQGAGSMDEVLDRFEEALREQVRKGTTAEDARAALDRALERVRGQGRASGTGPADEPGGRGGAGP